MGFDQIHSFLKLLHANKPLELSNAQWTDIEFSHTFLLKSIQQNNPIYGVNTGFGSMCNISIPKDKINDLQSNLLITHAAGVGEWLSQDLTKSIWLLKIINISKGFSGVSPELVQRLLDLYNLNLIPVIHSQGSLGASGDLAPLAELFLPLIGLGKFWINGQTQRALPELSRRNLQPLTLQAKEALSLINGTQFMLAHALKTAELVFLIKDKLPLISAASILNIQGKSDPFLPQVHALRMQNGQQMVAKEIYSLIANSTSNPNNVQDPYSFRCIPQVHGSSYDALDHCLTIWENELNAVTDNPNIFPHEEKIISAGNFHGQPLALTMDYAAIAIAEIASIAERRIFVHLTGNYGKSAYLCTQPGLDSGFMIAQYAAASLVSQNKQLCTPSSIDSITSSNGQEDHVSMGANGGLKLLKVCENTMQVLAIEYLICAQANALVPLQNKEIAEFLLLLNHQTTDHTHIPMNELIEKSYQVLWKSTYANQ